MDVTGRRGESKTDAQGSQKKGDKKSKAQEEKVKHFTFLPDNHEGVEGNDPIDIHISPDRKCQKNGKDKQDQLNVPVQKLSENEDKSPARPETEQSDTDNKIGKVIPVLDGKEFHKDDLIRKEGHGNKENRCLQAQYRKDWRKG